MTGYDWRNADEFPVRCANCKHWDRDDRYTRGRDDCKGYIHYGTCKRNAVKVEYAGSSLALMAEDGDCREYDDVFEPTEYAILEYEEWLRESEDMYRTKEAAWREWKVS